MRVAFFGTPPFALPTLAALLAASHDIAAVYTRAPKPAGRRGLDLTSSPVHVFAEARGLPVRTPRTLRNDEAVAAFAALDIDVAVVVGYGLLLPSAVLAAPRHGCLNLHPSLLPRWRGAAPIQRPIIAGDTETAAAVMLMEEGLDTGPVALEERLPIPPEATAGDMHDVLAARGADLMIRALDQLATGRLTTRAQAKDGVLYADKIGKAETRIDWSAPAPKVHDRIRGLSPTPGAFFEIDFGRGPERIKVLRSRLASSGGPVGTTLDDALTIGCGTGAVQLLAVQRAGKPPMESAAFLRGTKVPAGTAV